MFQVQSEGLLALSQQLASAKDLVGIPGTKRYGSQTATKVVVVFAQVYPTERNGLAIAAVLEQHPQILGADVQVLFVLVQTDASAKVNFNRLPVGLELSGDFVRAALIRDALAELPVEVCFDVQENDGVSVIDPTGWILDTFDLGTDEFANAMPQQVRLKGLVDQQARTGTRPFGTIALAPSIEVLSRSVEKGGIPAALKSVFVPMATLGLLSDAVELTPVAAPQDVYQVTGIVPVPDASVKYTLAEEVLTPLSFAGKGTVIARGNDGSEVVMEADGQLVLGNAAPSGNDPMFYIVQFESRQDNTVQVPAGL